MIIESLRARVIISLITIIAGVLIVLPNFVSLPNWWLFNKKLAMGLDIQGGLHLVLGVDTAGVMKESTERLAKNLPEELSKTAEIEPVVVTSAEKGELQVKPKNSADIETVAKYFEDHYANMLQVVSKNNGIVDIRYYESYIEFNNKRIINQAVETIRNRIDEFGVSEPSIAAQGQDRILVQFPGIKDVSRAKALINTTARLDFQMVYYGDAISMEKLNSLITEAETAGNYKLGQIRYSDYISRLNSDLKGKIPENTVVYFEKSENADSLELGKIPYLIRTDEVVSGADLEDAYVTYNEYGNPEVAFKFNAIGAKRFGDLTQSNVKKRMAVVLDKVVKSAPVINQAILGGRGVITLGGGRDKQKMQDEANMIAMALRAGALPVSLEQLEERTVGPSLGADSIAKGIRATIIGAILVFIFMLIYYGWIGFVADFALALNVLYLIATLTSIGATLTLPGVAGIALTIGIAVDANIIINERIREELRKGTTLKLAIKEGYARAFSAIFDSHVTAIATAIVLIYFGTGPVRGFGVSLTIGLIISLFTSIFITRTVVDYLVLKNHYTQIKL